jgi:nitroimidazol reductase NimA-like FMN-containing flavoprotein (pyridoxamine 5'-phosphate oxidase superfamily)
LTIGEVPTDKIHVQVHKSRIDIKKGVQSMSDTTLQNDALEYASQTRYGILNYLRNDGFPVSRTLGSVFIDGNNVVFSTKKGAAKVAAINSNHRISIFFEKDGQDLAAWKSVLFVGNAEEITSFTEKLRLASILALRNPRYLAIRDALNKGEFDSEEIKGTALFKLTTDEIQFLDRSGGKGGPVTISVKKNA